MSEMVYYHKLQSPADDWFFKLNKHDIITDEKFVVGDEIVVCKKCKACYKRSTWDALPTKACVGLGCGATGATLENFTEDFFELASDRKLKCTFKHPFNETTYDMVLGQNATAKDIIKSMIACGFLSRFGVVAKDEKSHRIKEINLKAKDFGFLQKIVDAYVKSLHMLSKDTGIEYTEIYISYFYDGERNYSSKSNNGLKMSDLFSLLKKIDKISDTLISYRCQLDDLSIFLSIHGKMSEGLNTLTFKELIDWSENFSFYRSTNVDNGDRYCSYALEAKGIVIRDNQAISLLNIDSNSIINIIYVSREPGPIDVTFMHPYDGSTIDVRVDDSMSASEIVNELINAGFIQRTSDGYDLSVKGGTAISGKQSLHDGGATNKCIVRVVPATDAYGCPTVEDVDGIVPECMLTTFCGFRVMNFTNANKNNE